MRGQFVALSCLLIACAVARVHAQTGPAPGADGLPQLGRVGVAKAEAGAWAVAATAGFGLIDSQADEGGHQRLGGVLSAALSVTEGVAIGLRLDGRYDMHPDDAQGSDSSLVGEPTLRARLATPVSDALHVGLDLSVMVPGRGAPSLALDALRADARGLLTYAGSGWGLASTLGFRLDQSANAAPDLAITRPGDRLSLGLNDFNALLLGLGVWKRVGVVELLGEVTWDPWLGAGAPSALQSPLRVTAGARWLMSDAVAWELLVDGLLSQRPQPAGGQLVAVEPRFAVWLGLRFSSGGPAPAVGVEPRTVADTEPVVVGPTVTAATVSGRVTTADGEPVVDAEITLVGEGFERATRSLADGAYQIDDVPLGPATLRIQGRRLQTTEQPLQVVAAGVTLDVQPPALPPQGMLRGLVRSFDGRPLAAQIAVDPVGQTLTANAEGEFEVSLAPGEYDVRITVAGFGSQTRTVQIEDDGVTLLNVDLKKARR